jgi:WhiB family redox-sensing transcriptional regulator
MSDFIDIAAKEGHPAFILVGEDVPCAETDPDAYFPEPGSPGSNARALDALKVCAGCPVLQQCFDYAYKDPALIGIWGGTTYSQRTQMRYHGLRKGPFPMR